MSWSENRATSSNDLKAKVKSSQDFLENFQLVNEALRSLKEDENFQEDLQNSEVIAAIEHWSGKKRISSSEAAARFEDNYRIKSVFSKLQRLSYYCRQAGIGVPLDSVLKGEAELHLPRSRDSSNKRANSGENESSNHGKKRPPKFPIVLMSFMIVIFAYFVPTLLKHSELKFHNDSLDNEGENIGGKNE
mmetsp:Transcript_26090/g.34255  ORF Transcript_26090/g.34255 Transcript_26090/m.34255 type:complete len:190 (+) Transcript_26090:25-594(+)|eukprot:CAMPEP_0117855462 /NCGR_PEP_ID=MMETSP0950-20121206/639_1 /TAXON_ID=44440 /ORGANISM="Chattonella subsalsa, Strain CCMP2191" /LENGTH=189 /DNA_ID=CAMNT_0005704323 /DNA_START=9 /DNA_END=578 /DNA_ORIENTATION=+